MRTNSITKFLMLVTMVFLMTGSIFAQGKRNRSNMVSNANWETYQICDDSVSAIFPVAPTEQVRNTDLGNGSVLTLKMNTGGKDNSFFQVNCLDGLPFTAEEMTPDEQKALFTRMMENYTKLLSVILKASGDTWGVKRLPVRATILGGRSGFEQDFTIGASKGKAKMVLYGTRGIWTIAMSRNAIPPREKTAFFGSLQINESGLQGNGQKGQ